MRKLKILGLSLALAGVVIPTHVAEGSRSVSVRDYRFSPGNFSVSRNTVVTWRFGSRHAHNVTVAHGPVKFHSSNRRSGTFSKRLTRKGVYHLVCTRHRGRMQMYIRVR